MRGQMRPFLRVTHPAVAGLFFIALMFPARLLDAADEPGLKAPSAKEILERTARTYAACQSYCDTGLVKTTFVEASRNWTDEKPFKTAFVRPDRFRFEYCKKDGHRQKDRYIVWRNGKEVQTWWDVKPGIEKWPSLSRAVGGATGVSGGSAHNIPALLLPGKIGGRLLTDLDEAKRIGDAKLGDTECFRVHGTSGGSPTTLWIDKCTYLVRRIDSTEKVRGLPNTGSRNL